MLAEALGTETRDFCDIAFYENGNIESIKVANGQSFQFLRDLKVNSKNKPVFKNLHFTDRTEDFKQILLDIGNFVSKNDSTAVLPQSIIIFGCKMLS